jgi:hypothetical protein
MFQDKTTAELQQILADIVSLLDSSGLTQEQISTLAYLREVIDSEIQTRLTAFYHRARTYIFSSIKRTWSETQQIDTDVTFEAAREGLIDLLYKLSTGALDVSIDQVMDGTVVE